MRERERERERDQGKGTTPPHTRPIFAKSNYIWVAFADLLFVYGLLFLRIDRELVPGRINPFVFFVAPAELAAQWFLARLIECARMAEAACPGACCGPGWSDRYSSAHAQAEARWARVERPLLECTCTGRDSMG